MSQTYYKIYSIVAGVKIHEGNTPVLEQLACVVKALASDGKTVIVEPANTEEVKPEEPVNTEEAKPEKAKKRSSKRSDCWEIIHDMDDEESGDPTCWVKEVNSKEFGKHVWITDIGETFEITVDETKADVDDPVLMTCKTLAAAKRWVTMNVR